MGELVQLNRDTAAVMVPGGSPVIVKQGAPAEIVQSLGGSFTVTVHGQMVRIEGKDADALGKEPPPKPDWPEQPDQETLQGLIEQQLHTCFDPEIPINIVDLGLIYRCELQELSDSYRRVEVDMTLTAPGCGMGDFIAGEVQQKILELPTVEECEVNLVFDPPWDRHMMSESARLATGMF